MRYEQHRIERLWLVGVDVLVRAANLVVVDHDGNHASDWECIVHVEQAMDLERRGYEVVLESIDSRTFTGTGMLVRTVENTIVLRGVRPLTEVESG